MLGHNLPKDIETYPENKFYAINDAGALKLSSEYSEDAVAIIVRKSNSDIYNISDLEREEINRLKKLLVTVGSNRDRSEVFFPDRYFENAELVGRPFIHGIFDCYTLLRDYYKRTFNVIMPTNIQRSWEWWNQGENLYVDNADTYSFVQVYEIKKNDILLMKLNSQVPNHGAIYLGDNKILHHMTGKLSTIEEFKNSYKFRVSAIYRHKDNINV